MCCRSTFTKYMLRLCLMVLNTLSISSVWANDSVVHTVLLYAPSCPHCHVVMNEVLPPLSEQYGQQLQVLKVDVSHPDGQALYQSAIAAFAIADTRQGVPAMIIGDNILVGSQEIPEQLPRLIEQFLAQGGVDWPAIPGLDKIVEDMSVTQANAAPSAEDLSTSSSSWRERFATDPFGNALAIMVLICMIVVVGYVVATFQQRTSLSRGWMWAIPVVATIGIGIAAYLSYIEMTHQTAMCGPVGDCNTVQQSEYAWLFGRIPIGILGLVGYTAIIFLWFVMRWNRGQLARFAANALLVTTCVGTLFSIYLSFLEPFIIGATCMWCLASAMLMTLLFWLAVRLPRLAY